MFGRIGVPELALILGLALLVFGPGRIAKLGGELGRSIKAFQEGLQGKPSSKESDAGTPDENAPQSGS